MEWFWFSHLHHLITYSYYILFSLITFFWKANFIELPNQNDTDSKTVCQDPFKHQYEAKAEWFSYLILHVLWEAKTNKQLTGYSKQLTRQTKKQYQQETTNEKQEREPTKTHLLLCMRTPQAFQTFLVLTWHLWINNLNALSNLLFHLINCSIWGQYLLVPYGFIAGFP